MLTKVTLEGPMGKRFGREWSLAVSSPAEALRMINANQPGVFDWIRANLDKYERYRVTCEYEDGKKEDLDADSLPLQRKLKALTFVPLVEGSGNWARIVLGTVLIAVAWWNPLGWGAAATVMGSMGASLVLGGVVGLLTPQPKLKQEEEGSGRRASNFFDGPVNTTAQGSPLQLIYGKSVLVGSHAISAKLSIDQMMAVW